jgi:hypothetical protein
MAIRLLDDDERLVIFDGLCVLDQDLADGAGLGAVIWFITFIASTISKVSPALTLSPGATNGAAPGSPDR